MGSSSDLEPTITMGAEEQKPKRRRKLREKSEGMNLDDGYRWCKYGEKPKIDSMFVRSYYRCSNKITNCTAKKTIDKHKSCKTRVNVTYNGEHNHPLPANKEVVVFHYKLNSGCVENIALASPKPERNHHSGISSETRWLAPTREGAETEGKSFPVWNGMMEDGVGIESTQAPCFSTPTSFSSLTCLENYVSLPSLPPPTIQDVPLPSAFHNPALACVYDPSLSLSSLPSSSSSGSSNTGYYSDMTGYGLDLDCASLDQPLYHTLTELDGFDFQNTTRALHELPGLDGEFIIDQECFKPTSNGSKDSGFDWDLFDYLISQDQTNSPSASDISFQNSDH